DGGASDDGEPYFVMEYVAGEPLDVFAGRRAPPLRKRLEIFLAVCRAVRHAHQNLVVHCDLKPRNILVTVDGKPKLLDFGMAKLLADPSSGRTSAGFATPAYASPEQLVGESVTTATDVYGLGIVLYQLLSGEHPFASEMHSSAALERAILDAEPAPPS